MRGADNTIRIKHMSYNKFFESLFVLSFITIGRVVDEFESYICLYLVFASRIPEKLIVFKKFYDTIALCQLDRSAIRYILLRIIQI